MAYFSLFHVRQVAYTKRSVTNEVATDMRVGKSSATALSGTRGSEAQSSGDLLEQDLYKCEIHIMRRPLL